MGAQKGFHLGVYVCCECNRYGALDGYLSNNSEGVIFTCLDCYDTNDKKEGD